MCRAPGPPKKRSALESPDCYNFLALLGSEMEIPASPMFPLPTRSKADSVTSANQRALPRRQIWAIAAILVIYVSCCMGLATTRAPWYDEGFLANPPYAWITTGYPGVSILDDSGPFLPWNEPINMRGIREHIYLVMPLYVVALAGWMKIFGFGLLTSRSLTVLCGALVLVVWYYVVQYVVADASVAMLTSALISVDYGFLIRASEVRMDMMSAALGFGGLAIYLCLRSRSSHGRSFCRIYVYQPVGLRIRTEACWHLLDSYF